MATMRGSNDDAFWNSIRQSGVRPVSVSVSSTFSEVSEIDVKFVAADRNAVETFWKAVAARQWIDVSEDTPASDHEVLVCLDGSIAIAQYWGDEGWSIHPAPEFWCPLPDAAASKKKKKRKKR